MVAVRPLWTPGQHWSLAQEDQSITSWGSSAPPRWMVMPQGHSQSPHTSRISSANLSPSFSNSTMFHVLWSITCPLLTSPSTVSTTQFQVKPTPSRWGDNTEGWVSNWSLQEPLGCCWEEGAVCRPCHTISDASETCGWASASHKTNYVGIKCHLGHYSSWNKCGDATPCWHGGSHKVRGTLRPSAHRELQFNLNP